jgi:hypothetical protein
MICSFVRNYPHGLRNAKLNLKGHFQSHLLLHSQFSKARAGLSLREKFEDLVMEQFDSQLLNFFLSKLMSFNDSPKANSSIIP